MATTATRTLKITMKKTYRDTITGFTGIATGHCLFDHEPNQVQLENEMNSRWFPESRLELVSSVRRARA